METQEPRQIGVPLIIGIVLMPYFFVWLLFRVGYSNIARVAGVVYLGLLVIAFSSAMNESMKAGSTSGGVQSNAGTAEVANSGLHSKFSGNWVFPTAHQNLLGKFDQEGLSVSSEEHPIATAAISGFVRARAAAECERPINRYGEVGAEALKEEQFLIDSGYKGHYYYAVGCEAPSRTVSLYVLVDASTMVSFLCASDSACGDRLDIVKQAARQDEEAPAAEAGGPENAPAPEDVAVAPPVELPKED